MRRDALVKLAQHAYCSMQSLSHILLTANTSILLLSTSFFLFDLILKKTSDHYLNLSQSITLDVSCSFHLY